MEKGVREGWSRRFRCSERESSVVARERRRKSRRAVVLKQNEGERVGISDGLGGAGAVGSCDMADAGGGGVGGDVGDGKGLDQKYSASLNPDLVIFAQVYRNPWVALDLSREGNL